MAISTETYPSTDSGARTGERASEMNPRPSRSMPHYIQSIWTDSMESKWKPKDPHHQISSYLGPKKGDFNTAAGLPAPLDKASLPPQMADDWKWRMGMSPAVQPNPTHSGSGVATRPVTDSARFCADETSQSRRQQCLRSTTPSEAGDAAAGTVKQ